MNSVQPRPQFAAAAVVGRRLPPLLGLTHAAHATQADPIRGSGTPEQLLVAAVLREQLHDAGRRVVGLDPQGDQPAFVEALRSLGGTPLAFAGGQG